MSGKQLWVYISGPYTNGDPVLNVHAAIQVAEEVRAAGFVPIVPHLSHLWHLVSPHEWEYWLDLDLDLLRRCDCLVRLPGASEGADREVQEALALGMPVLHYLGGVSLCHSLNVLPVR